MASYLYDVWKDVIKEWAQEYQILYGTSKLKMSLVTNPSPAITAVGDGQSVRFTSSSGIEGYPVSVSGFYEENGKTAMSDSKGIQFKLGGKFQFVVTKTFVNDTERFSVRIGDNEGYGASFLILADDLTWAEASSAMNGFRDEFDDAFQTLVEISTLTPAGVHEES